MTNPLEQIRELITELTSPDSRNNTSYQEGHEDARHAIADRLEVILDASQGYVCVPVEPTKAMLAAAQATNGKKQLPRFSVLRTRWSAMLATSKDTNRE